MAKPNYFATMKNFALQLSSEDWMILEFSQLGFIGTNLELFTKQKQAGYSQQITNTIKVIVIRESYNQL